MIGRWNPPTNFDHLVGDLLEMSMSKQGRTSIWSMEARSTLSVNREGARKAFGRRFGRTRVALESFSLGDSAL